MSECYLIHKMGRGFYRPDEKGYTSQPFLAGRYTYDDAMQISHPNGADGPRDGMSVVPEGRYENDEIVVAFQALQAGYERLRAKADKLAEALRTIESHRRKCHEHDDDCGNFRRTFDAEDVRLMEWQARAALKEWYEGDPDDSGERND